MTVSEYKFKWELHAHTKPASPCSDFSPADLVKMYAAIGFDGVVITNHFSDYLLKSDDPDTVSDTYLRDYYDAVNEGEKQGIRVCLGMEVRFPECANDYLVYGVGEEDIKTVFSYIHSDYPTFYAAFKGDHRVIVQAHPFRDGMVRQEPSLLDGIEVFNLHPGHNSRVGLASRYAHEHPHFIITCGTDFHHATHEGVGATRFKVMPSDSFDIAALLRSGDYIFDIGGSIVLP